MICLSVRARLVRVVKGVKHSLVRLYLVDKHEEEQVKHTFTELEHVEIINIHAIRDALLDIITF